MHACNGGADGENGKIFTDYLLWFSEIQHAGLMPALRTHKTYACMHIMSRCWLAGDEKIDRFEN